MSLNFISIPPADGKLPTRVLVGLHGWGSNARDLAPLAPMLALSECQFIFPEAPFAHPQLPEGRAWYSIETKEYLGLAQSRQILIEWLQSLPESTGVPLSSTFLSGFSQGGAMTLDVGLNFDLAGLCCLSGYLHSLPKPSISPLPPALIVHGSRDSIVPLTSARRAKDELTALGMKVEYYEFDMGHEIQPVVLNLMQNFISTKSSG